jgi:hypothetical protein
MSKSSSRFIPNLLLIAGILTGALLIYVFLLEEVKTLSKLKADRLAVLEEKNNKIEQNIVSIQMLSSKERIMKIASDSLYMVVINPNEDTLVISRSEIEDLERRIDRKYD